MFNSKSSTCDLSAQDQRTLAEEQKKFLEIDYDVLRERNFVTDTYFLAPELMNFMVFTAAEAYGTTYYHPAFLKFEDGNYIIDKLLRDFKDTFDNQDNTNAKNGPYIPDVGSFLPALKSCKTDADFIDSQPEQGLLLHRFLCFTLNFNNLFVYPKRLHDVDPGRIIYRIKSLKDDGHEDSNTDSQKLVVFHGTHRNRLYSLIRNGAKTLSTVINGRSYGHGFYCSPCFDTAQSYSDGYMCAYELSNAKKYNKGGQIYVVTDSQDLRLTCILSKTSPKEVVEHVRTGARKAPGIEKATGRIHSKRLLADVKRAFEFFSDDDKGAEHGVRVQVDERDFNRWRVFIGGFSPDTLLFGDMKRAGVREIELEAKFPNDYPFSPPFIRVLSPRFVRWTGHVTYGGSLCAEFLTLSDSAYAWQPVLSITAVLLMVKQLLSVDGRLESRPNNAIPYDEKEAREAFEVALKKHGWQ